MNAVAEKWTPVEIPKWAALIYIAEALAAEATDGVLLDVFGPHLDHMTEQQLAQMGPTYRAEILETSVGRHIPMPLFDAVDDEGEPYNFDGSPVITVMRSYVRRVVRFVPE